MVCGQVALTCSRRVWSAQRRNWRRQLHLQRRSRWPLHLTYEVPAAKRLIRAYQPHIFRSPSWQNGHVLDALVGELPCLAHEKTGGCGRGASGNSFDSCVMGFVLCCESMEKRLSVCRQIAPRLVFLATVAVLLQQSFCFTSHLHPFLNGTNLRRLPIAMGQYSSSCVSAVVLTLGVVDIEEAENKWIKKKKQGETQWIKKKKRERNRRETNMKRQQTHAQTCDIMDGMWME